MLRTEVRFTLRAVAEGIYKKISQNLEITETFLIFALDSNHIIIWYKQKTIKTRKR
jgi:hypothetical protein